MLQNEYIEKTEHSSLLADFDLQKDTNRVYQTRKRIYLIYLQNINWI